LSTGSPNNHEPDAATWPEFGHALRSAVAADVGRLPDTIASLVAKVLSTPWMRWTAWAFLAAVISGWGYGNESAQQGGTFVGVGLILVSVLEMTFRGLFLTAKALWRWLKR
jgi:hypothetical protein